MLAQALYETEIDPVGKRNTSDEQCELVGDFGATLAGLERHLGHVGRNRSRDAADAASSDDTSDDNLADGVGRGLEECANTNEQVAEEHSAFPSDLHAEEADAKRHDASCKIVDGCNNGNNEGALGIADRSLEFVCSLNASEHSGVPTVKHEG